jgi:hypothetical protein
VATPYAARATAQANAHTTKSFFPREKLLLLSCCAVHAVHAHALLVMSCMLCMHCIATKVLYVHSSDYLTNTPCYMSNSNHRVDLFFVKNHDSKELTQMQTRLNQWITAGSLLKFDITACGDTLLFRVLRKKDSGAA